MRLLILCIIFAMAGPEGLISAQQPEPEIELITVCQNFKGHGYYLSGSMVVMNESQGWYEDSMATGHIVLAEINKKPVIMIEDATGETKAAIQDGGQTFYVSDPGGKNILVGIVYPESLIETFLFNLDQNGLGVVLWTMTRTNGMIDSARLMKGQCYRPDD